jgi:homeodomain-containing protein
MEKYRVTLTLEERTELERLVSVGRAAARKLTHARILLLADALHGEEHADEAIVTALGASPKTVARVRKRLVTEGIEAAITPRPQPLRPGKIKIKGDVEQKLVELACTDPPRGRCPWTLQLLTDALVVLGLVEAISRETVRQALKKTRVAKLAGVSSLQASQDMMRDHGESADAASAAGGGSLVPAAALARP